MSEKISEQKALQAVRRRGKYVRMTVASALLLWAVFGCTLLYFYAIGYGSYPLGVFLLIAGAMLLTEIDFLVRQKPRKAFCLPQTAIDDEIKAEQRGVLGFWRILDGLSEKAGVREKIAFEVWSVRVRYIRIRSDMDRRIGLVSVTEQFMEDMDEPETESLVGHEIGHFASREDRWIGVIADASYFFRINFFLLMSCATLSISGMVWFVPAFGRSELLLLLATETISLVLGFMIMPIIRAFAHRQMEFMADAYGSYLTGTDALADALKKFAGRREGIGIVEYLSDKIGMSSHPATSDREKAIRALRP